MLGNERPDLTLINASTAALARTRQRLGALAERVSFIINEVLTWQPPVCYEVWHDRAVSTSQRARQPRALRQPGRPGPDTCKQIRNRWLHHRRPNPLAPTCQPRRSTQELTEEFAAGLALV
jgi:hypothetical protein